MIINNIFYLFNGFILLKHALASSISPVSLKTFALKSLNEKLKENPVPFKIVTRIFPHIFDEKMSLQQSGFNLVFYNYPIPNKEIDLSNLNINRIPLALTEKMTEIVSLDLSKNENLCLDEKWLYQISDKLKELTLKECYFCEDHLKVIASLKSLESLNISGSRGLNINSPHFITILKKLKHLSISNCKLDSKAFEIIHSNASRLEFLNFSSNDLSRLSFENPNVFPAFKETLKVLKLENCGLKSNHLERFFVYNNLEEIDLSNNNFSKIDEKTVEKLFGFSQNIEMDISSPRIMNKKNKLNWEIHTKQLKIVSLNNCQITFEPFATKLFDIEHLEELRISDNTVVLNLKSILKSPARNSLKALEIISCNGLKPKNLKSLTIFPKLEKLDASYIEFEDQLENFELGCSKETLQELNIKSSKLTIHGFKAITDCPKLKKLDASYNEKFENTLEGFELGKSKETLEELNIERSKLNSNDLKAITDCPKLEKLNASYNRFENIGANFTLGRSKNTLKELNLECSNLNINGLKAITDCPKLEKLNVSHCVFKNISESFELGCSKKSLKELNVKNTEFNLYGLKAITDCPKLEKLNASENCFENINADFKLGCSKKTLKELNVSTSKLNANSLKEFTDCPRLEILNASNNSFRDIFEGFELGCSKESLKELAIYSSKLNFNGLKAITDCPKLEILDARYNEFRDILKKFQLGRSKESLKVIYIQNSRLNIYGLNAITDCPKLKILDACYNNFEKSPEHFKLGRSKESLRLFDLSHTSLDLSALAKIGKCLQLRHLFFQGNNADKETIKNDKQYCSIRSIIKLVK